MPNSVILLSIMADDVSRRAWVEPLFPWRAAFNPLDHENILTTMAESIFVRNDGTTIQYKSALSAAIIAWEKFAHEDVAPICVDRIAIRNWRIYFASKRDLAKVKLMFGEHIWCIENIDADLFDPG